MSIHQMLQNDHLNPNMWDFFFLDNDHLRFLVKSTTLPFIKFESETRVTGEKFIKGYTPEDGFSITFIETADLIVYKFFKKWQDEVYDKQKRVFKNNRQTKDGILTLSKFQDTELADNTTGIKSFQFFNMVFLGFENINWDYTGTEGKEIVCTFSVDTVNDSTTVVNPSVK